MSEQTPPPVPAQAPRRTRLIAALPFIITAVAAVLMSLAIQFALRPPQTPPVVFFTVTPAAPTSLAADPTAAVRATPSPAPTPREGDVGVLRLEVLDLEAEDRKLWSALFLLRSAAQLDDTVLALQNNDFTEADRSLMAARRSLDKAYNLSTEQDKGPIDSFRVQLGRLRDDLGLRPEGVDRRLRQLRQLILAFVDDGT